MAYFPTSKKTWADLADNVSPANSSDINSAYAEITAIEDAFLTDSTSLNASTVIHGFLPKLSGTATEFLDGTGAWSTPSGASTDLAEHNHSDSDTGGLIRLDTISPPTDSTSLDASTDTHGLLPKLSGTSDNFLNGKGEWGTAGRELLTAARTYYVMPTSDGGSSDNTGLTSDSQFDSIQLAIDTAAGLDTSIYNITIQIADGTYVANTIYCKDIIGAGTVTIQGNASTPANVVIDGGFEKATPGTTYTIKNLKLLKSSGSATFGIRSRFGAYINLSGIEFGTGLTYHVYAGMGGTAYITAAYTITGSASNHLFATNFGTILNYTGTATITGTPAFTVFALCSSLGILTCTNTWTGSATGKRYSVTTNSYIYTGGGADYFPGDVAGDAATGGIYA